MIRVRFAPSPTGFLHIGGLRTCFYNWLYAKQNKGKFILRIEDTDRQRMVPNAVENLIKTLKIIGLDWDEFYVQSERLDLYQKYAQELIDKGHAYYCFCSTSELKEMKEKQIAKKMAPQYDGRCRELTQSEISNRIKNGKPYVVRLKVPKEGSGDFFDVIRGRIEIDLKNIDDQVLLKSDKWPTYHLANVVDDHLMNITHVIRGEEWLPSTIKHVLLYQFFGWKPPKFVHLPLLLNSDKSKLSKRQGDVAVEYYLNQGYLPGALLNFISLLGWNPGNDKEIFDKKELIKDFSLKKINKAGAIFNTEKLDWVNGHYIRQMPIDELTKKCIPYLEQFGIIKKSKDFEWLKKIVSLEQERMKKISEIKDLGQYFWTDKLQYDAQILTWKDTPQLEIKNNLVKLEEILSKIPETEFKSKNINEKVLDWVAEKGRGAIFWPWRVALSGLKASPPPNDIAEILGKKKSLKRVKDAIDKLRENT